MRIPLVRFGGDDRPIEPWEERLAPVVIPIVLPLLFAAIILMSAVGIALLLGHAAISPVLPHCWRLDWETAFDLDPSVQPECPACQAPMALGLVDKRGHVMKFDQGPELVKAAQEAECLQCHRSFRRFSLGKVWSSWSEHQAPNQSLQQSGGA